MPELISQNRSGLFHEHHGIAPVTYECRATIPAIEALQAAGAIVVPLAAPKIGSVMITLGPTMPANVVAVHINDSPWTGSTLGLRMSDEPEYPGEHADYWSQIDFTPCPVCGAPVVWYESGYVPGYRVCTQPPHHHSIAK